MPAFPIQCQIPGLPDPPPSINIPNYGVMQKAWSTLHSTPNPDELLMGFQDALGTALAPVKRYIQIVETMAMIQKCFQVIPDAIMQLSPDPVLDCIKNLTKAISRILSWMPPISYYWIAVDLANYCIRLVDELFKFFVMLDARLTRYTTIYDRAETLGDKDLKRIMGCAAGTEEARIVMAMDVMKFVKPANDILIEMFIRTMPGGDMVKKLKKVKEMYDEADAYIDNVGTALRNGESFPDFAEGMEESETPSSSQVQHELISTPPIGGALRAMGWARNAMVMFYNVIAPFTGLTQKEMIAVPEFNNF